tara:strand:- start:23674 stop:25422 length:1749 start_codon:yes stop_codon:yes gene_type:complete
MKKSPSQISLSYFLPKTIIGQCLKVFTPLIDRLLGIKQLQKMYLNNGFEGLEKQVFTLKLLQLLGVTVEGESELINKVPKSGRFIVVCNHPYGMIEGVIIARLLTSIRADTKVMANVGLSLFKEIQDYFIFANPLNPKATINQQAIKSCFTHLQNDGLLVIFPAGSVSSFQKDKQVICDAPWNRLSASLAKKTKTPVLPLFITGQNSHRFHQLGVIYYRFRLMMLIREMFKLKGKVIQLLSNDIIPVAQFEHFNSTQHLNDYLRLQCYLNQSKVITKTLPHQQKPIQSEQDVKQIHQELNALPTKNNLVNYRHFSVYYAQHEQIPITLKEITRLREITFRGQHEGSGLECDSDEFDKTYTHLFVFDHQAGKIVGAYRMGRTDKLLKQGGLSALYLSQIFQFKEEAFNLQSPCLELGRSFISPAYQNSFYALLLLWKGICAFAYLHPQYRTLYGTVSLSQNYQPLSITLMNKTLNQHTASIKPHHEYENIENIELNAYFKKYTVTLPLLSSLIKGLEEDNKEVPILLKHYHKMGGNFHALGIDKQFNKTPGFLLSVDLATAPDKLLNLYFGKQQKISYQAYRD